MSAVDLLLIVGLVLLYGALLRFLIRRHRTRVFPELAYFEPRKRRSVLDHAQENVLFRGHVFITVLFVIGGCTAVVLTGWLVGSRVRSLLGLVFLGGMLFSYDLLLRSPIRRSLRRQLWNEGLPICIGCGYDLTGNVSGVCPECGTVIHRVP